MRKSRRGHEDDVILARGNQYSTRPASASHSFSTKLQLGKKEKRWRLTFVDFAECLQAEIRLLPAWLGRAACARFTHSSRSVSELTFTVSQAARGWVHARRPVSGVARCRPGARRPTGRRRRPEASAPSSARPRGVFSEMPPRNRALSDGGGGQVHGPAWVRSLTVCL